MTSAADSDRDTLRWTMLLLGTVSHVIGAGGQYAINTLAPFYQSDLGLSRRRLGPRHASLDDAAARHGLARDRRPRPGRDPTAGATSPKQLGGWGGAGR